MATITENNIVLKRCPFCGAWGFELSHGMVNDPLAYWDSAIRGTEYGYVSCECGAIIKAHDEDEAIKLWNRRLDDLVKVVRCEDCVHWTPQDFTKRRTGYCDFMGMSPGRDGFCAAGERRKT